MFKEFSDRKIDLEFGSVVCLLVGFILSLVGRCFVVIWRSLYMLEYKGYIFYDGLIFYILFKNV